MAAHTAHESHSGTRYLPQNAKESVRSSSGLHVPAEESFTEHFHTTVPSFHLVPQRNQASCSCVRINQGANAEPRGVTRRFSPDEIVHEKAVLT